MNNIENLTEEQVEKLNEIKQKYNKEITKSDLEAIIKEFDLDKIITNNLLEWELKTRPVAKKFAKFTKKMNGKEPAFQQQQVFEFIKKNVDFFWEKYFVTNIKFIPETKEYLTEEIYATYIFSIFVTLHSKAFKKHQKILSLSRSLAEMYINSNRVKQALNELDNNTTNK